MKVLMLTPVVDEHDPVLGFIPTWINELASKMDTLHVVTLGYDGETALPKNVTVYNLGERKIKLTKYLYFSRIMFNLLRKRAVDVVFCHMYPVFTFMAAPWAKLRRIPVVQWYAHGRADLKLRLAHLIADKIVTSSKEGFRIKSNKVIITGQGIDTDMFKPAALREKDNSKHVVLSIGRISPVKDYETLIKAADILVNKMGIDNLEFIIAGGVPMPSQQAYYEKIVELVYKLALTDKCEFMGAIAHTEVVKYYQACNIFVNTSRTGSMDKAVLEAMACGKPVLTSNEAFKEILADYAELLLFLPGDPVALAEKIIHILGMNENRRKELGQNMREIVSKEHSIQNLTEKLVEIFESVTGK